MIRFDYFTRLWRLSISEVQVPPRKMMFKFLSLYTDAEIKAAFTQIPNKIRKLQHRGASINHQRIYGLVAAFLQGERKRTLRTLALTGVVPNHDQLRRVMSKNLLPVIAEVASGEKVQNA